MMGFKGTRHGNAMHAGCPASRWSGLHGGPKVCTVECTSAEAWSLQISTFPSPIAFAWRDGWETKEKSKLCVNYQDRAVFVLRLLAVKKEYSQAVEIKKKNSQQCLKELPIMSHLKRGLCRPHCPLTPKSSPCRVLGKELVLLP